MARQHASGRLTVRERIERAPRQRQLPRDGRARRAGRIRRGRRPRRLRRGQHGRRPGPHRRPPRRRPGRRLHDPRRRGGRRDLGEGGLRRAARARSAAAARAARRRHGRRRVGQDARADGLLLRAAVAGLRPDGREPVDRPGRGGRARPHRGPRRRPGRVLALLGDRRGDARSCSWPARRWWRWPGIGEAPDKEELGGARMQARAGAIDNIAADEDDALDQLRRFLAYLPQNVWEAPPATAAERPRRPPRGGAAVDRAARRAPHLQDAPHPRARARPRLRVRARRRLRPADHHLPRAARRPPGRRARLRPRALRRRGYGRGRRQDGALRGHLRPVPPARS